MNDAFDPSAVARNQPWIERAIEAVAPTWGLRRMEARVSRALFDYNAARATRIYNPKTNDCTRLLMGQSRALRRIDAVLAISPLAEKASTLASILSGSYT